MAQEILYLLLGVGSALGTGLITLATLYLTRDKRGADTMATMTDSVGKLVSHVDNLINERNSNTHRITELEAKFEKQKAVHAAEIERLEERHQEELAALREDHQREMGKLRADLMKAHGDEMKTLKNNHQVEMGKLQQSHQTQMDELKNNHQAEITRLNEALDKANTQIINLENTLGTSFKPNGHSDLQPSDSHQGAVKNQMDTKDG